MSLKPNFYKDRVCINVLAGSKQNAVDVYQAGEKHVLVGLLSKNYNDVATAVKDMRDYAALVDNAVSVGLGGGDPAQTTKVSLIAAQLQPQHVNQVFTGVSGSRMLVGQKETVVNALVSPSGTKGLVRVSTGPISSRQSVAGDVPVAAAIAMVRDMGGNALKFFPMSGLKYRDEYIAVAEACAQENFMLEPTGGIDLDNYREIVKIAVDAGVPKIIPHIYSSIIDKASGETRPEDVRRLFDITAELV